jgi:uncharacterized membrane protein HdeD (DUF308 family)
MKIIQAENEAQPASSVKSKNYFTKRLEKKMLTRFTQMFRNWWMYLVRGLFAVLFGILAIISPSSTELALVLLFGAYVLMDGALAVAAGIASYRSFDRWWAVLLEGVTGIVIGVMTFFWPTITALALVYFIAIWAVFTGIFEIAAAIEFRRVISGEWAMILGGLLSVVFGILLFVSPSAGAVSIIWLIGLYAITFGVIEMIFAFRLRSLGNEIKIVIAGRA